MADGPVSYRSALQVLGEYDRPALDAISTVLGTAIVAVPVTALLWP